MPPLESSGPNEKDTDAQPIGIVYITRERLEAQRRTLPFISTEVGRHWKKVVRNSLTWDTIKTKTLFVSKVGWGYIF